MSAKLKSRYSIEEVYDDVAKIREAKELTVDFLFIFLYSDRGDIFVREELDWFHEVYRFFEEREALLKNA